MRRHDRRRPVGERTLLTGYWLLSGYGLRATRAFGWLLAAMTASLFALLLCGVPTNDTATMVTGRPPGTAQDVALTVAAPTPRVSGPVAGRFTAARARTAGLVVVNSVVFRSSGQNLTFAGTCVEMASRVAEPLLLGLAVLAIRGRVKR